MSARRASIMSERRRSGKWALQGDMSKHVGSESPSDRLMEGLIKRAEWNNGGIELIYHVKVDNHTRVHRSATIVLDAKDKKERYLVLVRKKSQTMDVPRSLFFVQVILSNDGTCDVKMAYEVQSLKAIEVPEDTHAVGFTGIRDIETTFCFPTVDVSLYFESESERNETIWVIIKLCGMYGRRSPHCRKENRPRRSRICICIKWQHGPIPLPKEARTAGRGVLSRDYADEELEAEFILEEFEWLGEGQAAAVHSKSNAAWTSSSELQMEIISYLVEWEEEPGRNKEDKVKVSRLLHPVTKGKEKRTRG